ncbi:MAG: ATP-binding protein [Methanoregula sp.]|nr:ATP-binding protein [Methanoregula sp.]
MPPNKLQNLLLAALGASLKFVQYRCITSSQEKIGLATPVLYNKGCCHRHCTISSSVEIRIMEAFLNVWSPGRLASGITLSELFSSHASVLRNKGIAQIFYDMAWIERWGSGVQKIRTACAERAGATVLITTDDTLKNIMSQCSDIISIKNREPCCMV